jgi:hypothetical protein
MSTENTTFIGILSDGKKECQAMAADAGAGSLIVAGLFRRPDLV